MDMLDLALKYNDIEWARAIYNIDDAEYVSALDNIEPEETAIGLFTEKASALEDILTQYAVKEKDGLRNFNMHSEFDRNEALLVLVEKPPYKTGEPVSYYIPSTSELSQMRGIVNGYIMGYRDAFSDVNRSYAAIFAMNEEGKKASGSKGKRERKSSGKENKENTKAK